MLRVLFALCLVGSLAAIPQPAKAQRQPDLSDCERDGQFYLCRQPDGKIARWNERTYQRLKRQEARTTGRTPPRRRGASNAGSQSILKCGGDADAALSPRSLERIDLRYNTTLGSLVMVRDCGTWKPFKYNGEVMYELEKIPAAQRSMAKADIAGRAGMTVDQLERSLVLVPAGMASSREGAIAPRDAVYPYDAALEIDRDGVTAARVPQNLINPNTRVLGVRQVPWAITQTPEYQAEIAKRRPQQEAMFAALLLDAIIATRSGAGTGENCREEVQPIGPNGQARPVLDCD